MLHDIRDSCSKFVHFPFFPCFQVKQFAMMLCEDMELPSSFVPLIVQAMDEQINEGSPFADYYPTNKKVTIRLEVCCRCFVKFDP